MVLLTTPKLEDSLGGATRRRIYQLRTKEILREACHRAERRAQNDKSFSLGICPPLNSEGLFGGVGI